MKGEHVFVLSCNAGVLGVYAYLRDALSDKREYQTYGYKGLKVEQRLIG